MPARPLPGMPLDLEDADDDAPSTQSRFTARRNPWWRPASTVGRVFLGLAAFAILGGLVTSAYIFRGYLRSDGRFRIEGASNIDATGLTEVSRAEMLPVFGEDIGRNIFFVPLAERRRQLEEIPWIEKATVMRLMPDQIRVQVVERRPIAFVREGQQIGLVDANGVLLTMPAAMMAQHHYSFPVVTGIDAQQAPAERKARMDLYQRLLAELDSDGQKLSEQISEIDLTDPADARILMPEQGGDILAHFGDSDFLTRYQRYKAHINEWRQQYPKLAGVDLRYDQQAVLDMAQSRSDTPAANSGQTAADSAKKDAPAAQPAQAAVQPAEKPVARAKPVAIAKPTANAKPVAKAKPVAIAKTPAVSTKAKTTAKVATPAKPAFVLAKAGGKIAGKSRTAHKPVAQTAKTKQKKRAAPVKRVSVNASKPKPAPTSRPATVAGMGQ